MRLFWLAAVFFALLLTSCSTKGPTWVQNPAKTGAFEVSASLECGQSEVPQKCQDRLRKTAEERLVQKLDNTLIDIMKTFCTESGLGDTETAAWLYANVKQETLDRLLSRAQAKADYTRDRRAYLLLGVKSDDALPIVSRAVVRAVKSDELLSQQAEMIQAYETLDLILGRYR